MIHIQMRIRAAVVAMTVCAFALASHSTIQAKDTWTSVRSQNFQLIGNAVLGQITGCPGFESPTGILLFRVHAKEKNGEFWAQSPQVIQDIKAA